MFGRFRKPWDSGKTTKNNINWKNYTEKKKGKCISHFERDKKEEKTYKHSSREFSFFCFGLINEMEKVWPFVEFIRKNFTFRIVVVVVVVFFIILKLKNYLSFYYYYFRIISSLKFNGFVSKLFGLLNLEKRKCICRT